ncbi:MAG: acetyl-CoA acetyltransferase [Dehalococcoidales bacterium]|nr:acetyl-CoA acetyltransferase [Dehalococcoidales bacterium]
MGSIRDKVAIVGMGCTKFGELWDKSFYDLVVDAYYEAFEDAKIKPGQIQAAWIGTGYGYHRGTGLSPLHLGSIPITRVENACATATDALRNAAYSVAAGAYDMVLALGVEKPKDYGFSGLPVAPPSYPEVAMSHALPATPMPDQFALAANRYFYHYGIPYDEGKRILAKIAVKNHHNGTLSPKAHLRREITLEAALNAPIIAKPLGLFDCCGVSDGAAAAILTTPEIARKLRNDYILIKGLGIACGDEYAQVSSDFDWVHWDENLAAAKLAYAEAGITNPREQIDVAELHDCFTINELITYEDLGFSPRGKAKDDVNSGFFELTGGLPVNTDGGLKSFGHPIGASGLRMVYEIYQQLRGKAGPRQVKDAKVGLIHNLGGWPGAFTSAVAIFGKAE